MYRKYIALLIALLVAPVIALAATADDAKKFADSVGGQVLSVINGGGSAAEKQTQLQQLFTQDVDIDWMAKFVLGRGWDSATDAQRKQYVDAYRQYLLARYTHNFADYTGSKYTITGATSDADGQFSVSMKIKAPRAGQEETQAGYRLRDEGNGQFKIVDIIIENVSLITTQRADFASVLQQKGMDALIADLQAKAAQKQPS